MSIDKKKPDTDPADGVNTAADEAPDLDAVMRKYDRESATRLWEGTPQLIIRILMAAFGLFCIGMTLFSKAMPEIRLTMFVGCIIIIGFLTYPASKHHVRVNYLPWYDIVLMVVGAACFFYFALNAMTLVRLSTRIETVHVIIGVVGILILMELCRRCVGLPILCVAGVLIVYAFINQLSYAGAVNGATLYDALKTIIYKLFYTTSGVIGTPINVCYTYIVLFIIFGAFLERTGIANFFISFANRIAGWSSGGYGNYVIIYHGKMTDGNAYSTLYGHMRSVATSAGKYVNQGDLIGYVGSTGNSTGNHLHLEVWKGGSKANAVNPRGYIPIR